MKRLRLIMAACVTAVLSASCAFAETSPAGSALAKCVKSPVGGGPVLDLSRATMTFEDNFDRPDITTDGGSATWYTGVHGGFGGAKFLPYSPSNGPFVYQNGELQIRLQNQGGKWTSGLIQSVDSQGRGFSQTYGYFEMRAKMPPGVGAWPAFWLKTANEFTDKASTRAEIDVLEAYSGNDSRGYHASVHLWPGHSPAPSALQKHIFTSCYRKLNDGPFDNAYHTYGALVTPDWVVIYYDRHELMRFPSQPEYGKPLFILVDLANNHHETQDSTPSVMTVDYVRAWSLPGN
ncbi:MAG TPA: glycoside hydrolase family 16 protein [Asticcacaulis sp.]|nr:glycoside hydrolase family 16 protein [Asticcacaulis sp.]